MRKWRISKKAACVFLAGLALIWIPGVAAAVSILDYSAAPSYAPSSNTSSPPVAGAGNEVAYALTLNDATPGDYRLRPGEAFDEGIGCNTANFSLSNSLGQDGTDDRPLHANAAPVPKPTPMILLGIGLISMAGFRKKYTKE